jgi:GNAT superfamily N-acetyltransferase
MITYEWRGPFTSSEAGALHEEAFGGGGGADWRAQVGRHSLGWVCARDGGDLAGFVNVAWDGGVHAFILDTVVAAGTRRRGIGTGLVAVAVREASRAGCEWLHVDFDEHLRPFYVSGCGFTPAPAGLIAL